MDISADADIDRSAGTTTDASRPKAGASNNPNRAS
jgi:hypothetical protein